jgi:hypothetical protein
MGTGAMDSLFQSSRRKNKVGLHYLSAKSAVLLVSLSFSLPMSMSYFCPALFAIVAGRGIIETAKIRTNCEDQQASCYGTIPLPA